MASNGSSKRTRATHTNDDVKFFPITKESTSCPDRTGVLAAMYNNQKKNTIEKTSLKSKAATTELKKRILVDMPLEETADTESESHNPTVEDSGDMATGRKSTKKAEVQTPVKRPRTTGKDVLEEEKKSPPQAQKQPRSSSSSSATGVEKNLFPSTAQTDGKSGGDEIVDVEEETSGIAPATTAASSITPALINDLVDSQ